MSPQKPSCPHPCLFLLLHLVVYEKEIIPIICHTCHVFLMPGWDELLALGSWFIFSYQKAAKACLPPEMPAA